MLTLVLCCLLCVTICRNLTKSHIVSWSEHHICGSCHKFVLFNSMPSAALILGQTAADLWAVVECSVDDLNFVCE